MLKIQGHVGLYSNFQASLQDSVSRSKIQAKRDSNFGAAASGQMSL